jgi:hypothetical protein
MSQSQAAATSAIARYPKRKRAQVVYAEQEFDGEESDIQMESESESQDVNESSRSKVWQRRIIQACTTYNEIEAQVSTFQQAATQAQDLSLFAVARRNTERNLLPVSLRSRRNLSSVIYQKVPAHRASSV